MVDATKERLVSSAVNIIPTIAIASNADMLLFRNIRSLINTITYNVAVLKVRIPILPTCAVHIVDSMLLLRRR